MTKEEYLEFRKTLSINLLYEYYKEKFDKNEHSPFLLFEQFIQTIQLWPGTKFAFDKVWEYYDEKFSVVKLLDKEGNLIKYI